jgi:hypothetical protein
VVGAGGVPRSLQACELVRTRTHAHAHTHFHTCTLHVRLHTHTHTCQHAPPRTHTHTHTHTIWYLRAPYAWPQNVSIAVTTPSILARPRAIAQQQRERARRRSAATAVATQHKEEPRPQRRRKAALPPDTAKGATLGQAGQSSGEAWLMTLGLPLPAAHGREAGASLQVIHCSWSRKTGAPRGQRQGRPGKPKAGARLTARCR